MVGVIVVTTDKGLCGGLNAGIFRLVAARLQGWDEEQIPAKLTVFGNKGAAFFSRLNAEIISRDVGYGDAPSAARLVGAVKVMLDAYRQGEVDEVHLCFSKFVNTVKQEPQMERLLPIPPESVQKTGGFSWDYLYEPEAPPIVDLLLTRYVEAVIYQSAVGKHRLGAGGANGGDEGRLGQRRQPDRRTATRVQQVAPSRHHPGNRRDCRRSGGGLTFKGASQ